MRRTKLYQSMAVVFGLSTAMVVSPVMADRPGSDSGSSSIPVVPLSWTAVNSGVITVDGSINDWGDLSGGNVMCTRGSINADGTGCDGNGKEHLSTAYLRYDCSTSTMYVLVLKEDGYEAQGDKWVKVYDEQNSEYQSQLIDVGDLGYEASFTVAPGTTYNSVEIHMNVSGNTSSTGKISYTRSISVPECEAPTLACSDVVSNGKLIAEYESDGDGGYDFVAGSGTDIITINNGIPSVSGGTVEIATFIEDGVKDTDGVVSGDSVEFCQVPVFDSKGAEVCLWMADKAKDGEYINIEQVGCVEAKKHKFYAIEAAGEFSTVLEAE